MKKLAMLAVAAAFTFGMTSCGDDEGTCITCEIVSVSQTYCEGDTYGSFTLSSDNVDQVKEAIELAGGKCN